MMPGGKHGSRAIADDDYDYYDYEEDEEEEEDYAEVERNEPVNKPIQPELANQGGQKTEAARKSPHLPGADDDEGDLNSLLAQLIPSLAHSGAGVRFLRASYACCDMPALKYRVRSDVAKSPIRACNYRACDRVERK